MGRLIDALRRPSDTEIKKALLCMKKAGLKSQDLQRLIKMLNLIPAKLPPAPERYRFELCELLILSIDVGTIYWKRTWFQVHPEGTLKLYKPIPKRMHLRPTWKPFKEINLHKVRTRIEVEKEDGAFEKRFGRKHCISIYAEDAQGKLTNIVMSFLKGKDQKEDWELCLKGCCVQEDNNLRSIHVSAHKADLEGLLYAIENDINGVDDQNKYGMTALHYAVSSSCKLARDQVTGDDKADPRNALMCIAYLLSVGANPHLKSNMGENVAELAIRVGKRVPAVRDLILELLKQTKAGTGFVLGGIENPDFDSLVEQIKAASKARNVEIKKEQSRELIKAYGRLWELAGTSPEAKAVKSMQELVKNKVKVVNMGGPRRKKKGGEEDINPFTASLEKKRRRKEIEEAKRRAEAEAMKEQQEKEDKGY